MPLNKNSQNEQNGIQFKPAFAPMLDQSIPSYLILALEQFAAIMTAPLATVDIIVTNAMPLLRVPVHLPEKRYKPMVISVPAGAKTMIIHEYINS